MPCGKLESRQRRGGPLPVFSVSSCLGAPSPFVEETVRETEARSLQGPSQARSSGGRVAAGDPRGGAAGAEPGRALSRSRASQGPGCPR